MAEKASGTPVTATTLFAMGSTTKAYTAALVLDLVEDDVLSLSDALAEWVPEFPNADEITLRQLSLHTSGLAQIAGSDVPAALEEDPDRHLTAQELILEPVCAPGDCYHYQSPDFGLLGEVIERATGNTFAGELRRRVLRPLGLRASYLPREEEFEGPVAFGYGFGPATPADEVASLRLPNVDDPYPPAGGGLLATTSDVARFQQALFSGRLLSEASLAEMLDFSATEDMPGVDECSAVGIGATRGSIRGHETWGFGGFTGNFHSSATYLPKHGLTVVAVVNDGGDTAAMTQALADLALPTATIQRPDFLGGSCNYDVYSSRADGSALKRLTNHRAADGGTVAWAPDGRVIGFTSDREGNADVFSMTSRGRRERNLTSHPAEDAGPSWSPDGSRIAFWSDRRGSNDIYVMDADGAHVDRLTSDPGDEILPAWSPDGAEIAYVGGPPGGVHDLWLVNADGSRSRRLTRTATDEWWPTWSPDGKKIAYVFDHRVVGGGGIRIISVARRKARLLDVHVDGPVSPAWASGGRLALVDFSGDLWTANPDGSRLRRVTHSGAKEFGAGWSPDGRRLAFPSGRWYSRSTPAGAGS